jgi:hypothetical protein
MSDFDFSKFPRVKELIDESSLKGKEDRIIWLRFTREQAALLLAEMHLMATAALSSSIPLRNRSKESANYYYDRVGNFLHLVAKEEAWSQLGINGDDSEILYRHKSIFGMASYMQQLNDH